MPYATSVGIRRVVCVSVIVALGAVSCGGAKDGGPSKAAIDDFCDSGLLIVQATMDQPGSQAAIGAFKSLDTDTADALDIRIRRLDPAKNLDAADMASRLVDAGCNSDDLVAIADTVRTAESTAPNEAGPTDTAPGNSDLPNSVPDSATPNNTNSPLSPSEAFIGVAVPAEAPSQAVIDLTNEISQLLIHHPVEAMKTLGMDSAASPMFFPLGGHLYSIKSDNTYGSPDDQASYLMSTTGTPQAVLDALVAAVQATDAFSLSNASESADGISTISARLEQEDYVGPNYNISIESSTAEPGVIRISIGRTIFSDGNSPSVSVPRVVRDGLAERVIVAQSNGLGEPTGWLAEVGIDDFFDEPTERYSLQWAEAAGDFTAIGKLICATEGLTVSSNDEYSVTCATDDYLIVWTIYPGGTEGSFSVTVTQRYA